MLSKNKLIKWSCLIVVISLLIMTITRFSGKYSNLGYFWDGFIFSLEMAIINIGLMITYIIFLLLNKKYFKIVGFLLVLFNIPNLILWMKIYILTKDVVYLSNSLILGTAIIFIILCTFLKNENR